MKPHFVVHPDYQRRDPRRIGVRQHGDNLFIVQYAHGLVERALMRVEGGGTRLLPVTIDRLRYGLGKRVRVAGEVHYFGRELPWEDGLQLAREMNQSPLAEKMKDGKR